MLLRCRMATLFSGDELTLRSFSLALTSLKQGRFAPKPPACVAAEPAMPGASHPPRRDSWGRDAASTRNAAASNERNGRTVKFDAERAEQVSTAPSAGARRGDRGERSAPPGGVLGTLPPRAKCLAPRTARNSPPHGSAIYDASHARGHGRLAPPRPRQLRCDKDKSVYPRGNFLSNFASYAVDGLDRTPRRYVQ